jgi:hypothetical protein
LQRSAVFFLIAFGALLQRNCSVAHEALRSTFAVLLRHFRSSFALLSPFFCSAFSVFSRCSNSEEKKTVISQCFCFCRAHASQLQRSAVRFLIAFAALCSAFVSLLQRFCSTFAALLQRFCSAFAALLQRFCSPFAALLHCNLAHWKCFVALLQCSCGTFAIRSQSPFFEALF